MQPQMQALLQLSVTAMTARDVTRRTSTSVQAFRRSTHAVFARSRFQNNSAPISALPMLPVTSTRAAT